MIHVQCYQTFVAPLAMAAASSVRKPFLLTFHGGGHSSRLRHSLRTGQLKALRPFLRRAAALVATAEWEIDYYSRLLDLDRRGFVLIPNGGDLPTPAQDRVERNGTLIVSIGRAERYKGHQRVLAAFPHILAEFEDARLWIAGDGPYVQELRKLAGDLGVQDRVEVAAVRDREEYTRRLAGASVATLFSDFETHPMGALEAIKLGIPTLVADNSGLGELARKGRPMPSRSMPAAAVTPTRSCRSSEALPRRGRLKSPRGTNAPRRCGMYTSAWPRGPQGGQHGDDHGACRPLTPG